jgi:hypothetical protein
MPEETVLGPSEEVIIDTKLRMHFPPGVVGLLGLRRKADREHRMRVSSNIIGKRVFTNCRLHAHVSRVFLCRAKVKGNHQGPVYQPSGQD